MFIKFVNLVMGKFNIKFFVVSDFFEILILVNVEMIINVILKQLEELNINVNKFVSFFSDGVLVMIGKINGVVVKL